MELGTEVVEGRESGRLWAGLEVTGEAKKTAEEAMVKQRAGEGGTKIAYNGGFF